MRRRRRIEPVPAVPDEAVADVIDLGELRRRWAQLERADGGPAEVSRRRHPTGRTGGGPA